MNLLEGLLRDALIGSSGPSGSTGAVLYTRQSMTPAQQAQARENIGSEAAARVVPVAGQEVTITPEHNCVYQCGELQALTITNPPETGAWVIHFRSGAAATTTTVPDSILGLERFAAGPNTLYEINVLDGRALYHGWPVPAEEEAAANE